MEAVIAVFKEPGGQLAIEILILCLLLWNIREGKESRKHLHSRIDKVSHDVHARIDALTKDMHRRDVHDAERWGKICGKLHIDDEPA